MKRPPKYVIAYKALRELGINQVGLNALYKLGLSTGHYRRQLTKAISRLQKLESPKNLSIHPCLRMLPAREDLRSTLGNQVSDLFEQANEIVTGRVRLFGGKPVPLVLSTAGPLAYWTSYEGGNNDVAGQDIKVTWEPARFGWAITLARAYYLNGNEQYAESFWEYTEQFLSANPPYLGPQWASAQEVAIRLVALAFVYQVFKDSSQTTPDRATALARAIAVHAERIPPTMVYARSQNNNHLVTEALGLYTASALLPEHPLAMNWHSLGWKWLQIALREQFDPDGEYVQHSTNYHRLALQAALWMWAVHEAAFSQEQIPVDILKVLGQATNWLSRLVDPITGQVPNLGHNDGAYILSLTICPITDYRPVLEACSLTFLNKKVMSEGPWDEMSYWLSTGGTFTPADGNHESDGETIQSTSPRSPYVIMNSKNSSWAYFRVARYHSRPAHADELHVDLWWRGVNLALDPGTYLYNAPAPWENSLTCACVHNTVTIDGLDFMLRASRFLYLDWAQASLVDPPAAVDGSWTSLTARHNGYQKINVSHVRKISALDDGHWEVIDRLEGPPNVSHTARLHWLLPDWEYDIHETEDQGRKNGYHILINTPNGWIRLLMKWSSLSQNEPSGINPELIVVRAGERVYGTGNFAPINGWYSPTYGEKLPALACIFEVRHALPIELSSEWTFPSES